MLAMPMGCSEPGFAKRWLSRVDRPLAGTGGKGGETTGIMRGMVRSTPFPPTGRQFTQIVPMREIRDGIAANGTWRESCLDRDRAGRAELSAAGDALRQWRVCAAVCVPFDRVSVSRINENVL